MDFIDLKAQQKRIKDKIESNIRSVLNHGRYIMGPEIEELELRLSEYTGVNHAIACSSGTDALLLALMALDTGPGDAVLTTPFTFVATAEVVSLLGATPVFVDIEPDTFNISPTGLDLAIQAVEASDPGIHPLPRTEHSALRPKAVIPVDLFGLPADYDSIISAAAGHNLPVVEDAAQSLGGVYKGRKACALGEIGCTSFFPAKPLGAYGDGGMCFTRDRSLAHTIRSLVVHGQGSDKYENVRIGINGRLDTLQAAILLAKLEIFPEELDLRAQAAERYNRLLSSAVSDLTLPLLPEGYSSAWAQYSVLARDRSHRNLLQGRLQEAGIPTAIYYPTPLHLQPAYEALGYLRGDFPISEDCASRIFSLPMHPYLDPADQERIAEAMSTAER
ncbi:MAG: DegT/DnrJ/EryC1/StrS family aminotransferase [Desulfobacteraceae bacterium]